MNYFLILPCCVLLYPLSSSHTASSSLWSGPCVVPIWGLLFTSYNNPTLPSLHLWPTAVSSCPLQLHFIHFPDLTLNILFVFVCAMLFCFYFTIQTRFSSSFPERCVFSFATLFTANYCIFNI